MVPLSCRNAIPVRQCPFHTTLSRRCFPFNILTSLMDAEFSGYYNYTPPSPAVFMYPSFDETMLCTCNTELCCYDFAYRNGLGAEPWVRINGTGSIKIVLSSVDRRGGEGGVGGGAGAGALQVRYKICEAPTPASPPGSTSCMSGGDLTEWNLYHVGVPLVSEYNHAL